MDKIKNKCAHAKDCWLLTAKLVEVCSLKCQYFKRQGKVFSKVNRGQRVASDGYQTPISMVRQFLEVEYFDPGLTFLEPAKGSGNIVCGLREYKYRNITAYDIVQTPVDVPLAASPYNFFNESRMFDYIVTNPPFRMATDFIKKAVTVCRHKFALLMPINYLHGQARYKDVYSSREFPFGLTRVWVFTRMPMLTAESREDGMYNTGMQVYAWYLFVRGYEKKPTIDWIDNNAHVIRGARK